MHIHTTKKREKIKDISENYTAHKSPLSQASGMFFAYRFFVKNR